jgi:four helix bundle protein
MKNLKYQWQNFTPVLSFESGGFSFGDGCWVIGDRGRQMFRKVENYDDLEVYQKLLNLHLDIHSLTLTFPKFELYELGSQMRRSSNSAPANLAEGWNNKHINIYLEGINRALGEINETKHHLLVAHMKNYINEERFKILLDSYNNCGKMLTNLKRSLINNRLTSTTNTSTKYPSPTTHHL